MRLIQFLNTDNQRQVGVVHEDDKSITPVRDIERVYDLALVADRIGSDLSTLVGDMMADETVDYDAIINEDRLMLPLDHPDPAHCILSGTGLDHLGSAQARDSMHAKLDAVEKTGAKEELTDSMKMFKLGLEGGKPAEGEIGSQPEWFYKGDGDWLAHPGQPLQMPSFALDGGEEPELVGLYVIGDVGNVLRVGFALGNEFSDHVLEKQNYLYLAHSKLRASSFGPELLLGEPPADVRGTSRLLRKQKNGKERKVWSGDFLTGEENMTHTLANIEHHHFKYPGFRRPGDVHCHYFGTATLSFVDGVSAKPGDIFEISSPGFGRPLRNPLELVDVGDEAVVVQSL